MIKVYGIKNCDSVKKALSFFKKHNIAYELYDFKTQELPCSKITQWLQKTNIDKLFNARSTTYRNLKLKEMNLSDEEKAEWLCRENLLIKRPVIEFDDKVIVGYNEQEYIEKFNI
ncbi:arsenate reductase family protein [Sulfurimonas paralvinellae]|uniref:Spx/MgsR family RNA polymerase-binding regulatory protein n=1 Tax=Sulfurimonas paralvinellae TaxID=317658 RepID=A0A7M1B8C3_9BACT|nr:Spx/MgsR family RNA polymerase-binding regulatory protein [Sulfurimonas paralvinellae]QOP45954.1 Spx/MgsR family RNA polymerase-binding regulatory protein [Sulfurimonas paralvinellae]